MRGSTEIHYRLESVGKPEHTFQGQDSVANTIKKIAQWLLAVPMGSKIRVVLARDESELKDRRSAANQDMMDELNQMIDGQEQADGHS